MSRGKVILKPLPVLVACAGCAEYGQAAQDVARRLDALGRAELGWLGRQKDLPTLRAKVQSRYPVFTIDACDRRCARTWLFELGVAPQRCIVLSTADREDPAAAAERLAAEL